MARIEYPDGTWRDYSYDPLGNIVEERSPHGSILFERDALGRIERAILDEYGGKVSTSFERDALGRVVAETQDGRTIRYEHDARGRRSARILPGGETTRYHYDPLGALVALDHDGHKVAIERDVLGRETRKHVYRSRVDIQSGYDAMGRLAQQRVCAPAPAGGGAHSILSQRRWRHDAAGRVSEVDDERWGTTHYQYDAIGQLVAATRGAHHEVFEYDPTGSLVNILGALGDGGRAQSWSVLPGNVLTKTPETRYEYDLRGRRVKKRVAHANAPEQITEYSWDCRDRLREIRLPSGARVRFTYDAFSRRVRKEVVPAERSDFASMVALTLEKGRSGLPERRVVEFLWDGDVLAAEIDSARGTRVFVHQPRTLAPVLQQESGSIFTYINDHLGTPRELIDEDGRVAWAAAYSAWGRVVDTQRDPKAKHAVSSPFRMLGQYHDEETGSSYVRFRYFDHDTGRWLSPDPLGLEGGMNLFAFAGSPTMSVDPFGLADAPCRTQVLRERLIAHLTEELGITRKELPLRV